MNKFLLPLLLLTFCCCDAQTQDDPTIAFTSDLATFEELSGLKAALTGVEIIALGENTHGLGEVFAAKTALVKFLHEELGFDLVLFESGYGDAALAWEHLDTLSGSAFTNIFSSNFYYRSAEIEQLVRYAKSRNGGLKLQGFDCQPQQNYLIRRMAEIAQPLDSVLAKSVPLEMRSFNMLYQFENNQDTLAFNEQRDRFIGFLHQYNAFLDKNTTALLRSGTTENEIRALQKANAIFIKTYAAIRIGELMGWPASANIRDNALFEMIRAFKAENPEAKIIIWAQNSHIENRPKPNDPVHWMGHRLKSTFGDKYYALGAVVYSGKNLNYNGTFDFEHKTPDFLAYHLNRYPKEKYVLDLRKYPENDFTTKLLLGMENNGNTAAFVAKDRFDGLLFIRHSDIPRLLQKE